MKQFSEETRRRMSESAKARCTAAWRAAKSESQATRLPEDEVRAMYASGLSQAEIAAHYGVTQKVVYGFMKRRGIKARVAAKRNQTGRLNDSWKGDDALYSSFHSRVYSARGKPSLCEKCGETSGRFEWANVNGRYGDVSDYVRLCASCHRVFDAQRRRESGQRTAAHIPRKRKEVDA